VPFAADETFLHDRSRQTAGGGAAGENFAGRARADYDHIESGIVTAVSSRLA
jgi:hypothetical protein